MIPGSKGLNPHELAHSWGLLTPTSYDISIKRYFGVSRVISFLINADMNDFLTFGIILKI